MVDCRKIGPKEWVKKSEHKAVGVETDKPNQTKAPSTTAEITLHEGVFDGAEVDAEKENSQSVITPKQGKSNEWEVPRKVGNSKIKGKAVLTDLTKVHNGFNVLQKQGKGLNKRDKQHDVLSLLKVNKVGVGALLENKMKTSKVDDMMDKVAMLKSVGSKFTWCNKQDGGDRVYSSIDHAFSNEDWVDEVSNSVAKFHWENFKEMVKTNWNKPLGAKGLKRIMLKLHRLKHALKVFNRKEIGDVEMSYHLAKKEYQQAITCAQADPTNHDLQKLSCAMQKNHLVAKSRLTEVLPTLIGQNQGAFVKGRSLAHNILIFQDLIKNYNRKNTSPRCALKIDLCKAYDTVDWDFLERLLTNLRFPTRFINWIMFGTQNNEFRFHPMCKSLKIINLCFVDELIIFRKANRASVAYIKGIFDIFYNCTGLKANISKSQVYFGGVPKEEKRALLHILQFEEGLLPLKYLGVPMRPTNWKAEDCGAIIKKIKLRLHSWANRHLSYAGRCQLINLVLLELRNYWMNIFLLPKSIIKEVDKLCL
uniref:Reverse transcriptase domain-containing protein n=1 Tax=Cannabis sativa TaxID=3483 RepID=A0A803P5W4_CANSA